MFIISSGRISEDLATLSREYTDKSVLGVCLNDLALTIKNRGVEHFDSVLKIIVTDSALDSLTDLSILNDIAQLKGDVYFINRESEVTKHKVLPENITEVAVDVLDLEIINSIILTGGL